MNTKQVVRNTHRYLGIFVGIQIFFWTVSGIYFAWTNIEEIRGEHLAEASPVDIRGLGQLADISPITDSFEQPVQSVQLRTLLGAPVYEVRYRDGDSTGFKLVDAQTGDFLGLVDEETAVAVARNDFAPEVGVRQVDLLNSATPHDEYRGSDLPVYRVAMDHASGANIYVSAQRGVVTARRTTSWRIFDFLWMLHTLDFVTRDNFNNVVIRILSVLGIITILSGFVYWGTTSPWFNRKLRVSGK